MYARVKYLIFHMEFTYHDLDVNAMMVIYF